MEFGLGHVVEAVLQYKVAQSLAAGILDVEQGLVEDLLHDGRVEMALLQAQLLLQTVGEFLAVEEAIVDDGRVHGQLLQQLKLFPVVFGL